MEKWKMVDPEGEEGKSPVEDLALRVARWHAGVMEEQTGGYEAPMDGAAWMPAGTVDAADFSEVPPESCYWHEKEKAWVASWPCSDGDAFDHFVVPEEKASQSARELLESHAEEPNSVPWDE